MPEQSLPKIIALVPMRHHSQRVPGKNYRLLDGKPLYQHILKTLLNVTEISEIVVDTDSPVIIEGVLTFFPTIKVIERPPELRADDISMNTILQYDISQAPADFYLQTHSTNPVVESINDLERNSHFSFLPTRQKIRCFLSRDCKPACMITRVKR